MADFALLLFEFMKTGLFAVGGGYATLPYLYDMAVRFDWFTLDDLTNFIAVSEVTPGPIGINMATFAGYLAHGVIGGVGASLALVFLPTLLILLLLRFMPDVTENTLMRRVFYGLIPAACGLIFVSALYLLKNALLSFETTSVTLLGTALLALLLFLSFRFRLSPFWLLLIGGVYGLIFL